MSPAQRAAIAGLAATLAASAAALPGIVKWEGWVTKAAPDPVGIITACSGVTKGVVANRVYSDAECRDLLAREVVEHGLAIEPCLPAELPLQTRAAFISLAYNIGPGAFCQSTLSRKARAGDLAGACNELPRWVTAQTPRGRKTLPGLVKRREQERQLCLEGVASLRPAVSPT